MPEVTESELDAYLELRRNFSQAERDKLAASGAALPDGSFPIVNTSDLKNAIAAVGRASNKGAAKAHIIKRAKALGATDMLPEDWRSAEQLRAFSPGEPDADDMGGPSDNDGDECPTCDGSGKVDGETCSDCGGTGMAEPGGPIQNSADDDLERRKQIAERIDGTVERRDFHAQDLEIRSTSDGGLRFTGYASTTETPYTVSDFTETIARGAFKRTLADQPDVVLLVNHEGLPLARTKSGTLTLSEDSRGLRVDADLEPSDPDVQSLLPKMKRGDLSEMSFAFRATQQDWDEDYTTRTIKEVSIHRGDVSMVTHGANSETNGSVSLRAVVEEMEQRAGRVISKATKAKIEPLIEQLEELIAEPEPKEPPPEPIGAAEMFAGRSIEEMKRRRARVR